MVQALYSTCSMLYDHRDREGYVGIKDSQLGLLVAPSLSPNASNKTHSLRNSLSCACKEPMSLCRGVAPVTQSLVRPRSRNERGAKWPPLGTNTQSDQAVEPRNGSTEPPCIKINQNCEPSAAFWPSGIRSWQGPSIAHGFLFTYPRSGLRDTLLRRIARSDIGPKACMDSSRFCLYGIAAMPYEMPYNERQGTKLDE